MRKNFYFRILAASLLLMTAALVNAQDANNPWHLVVTDQDSKEVAAFNVETLDNVSLSAGNVKVDMTWDNKSQSYSYPIETTTFGFDLRESGTGTANEVISAEKWSVSYNSGILHVSNPAGPVAIYSISGMLVGQYPNQSEIPVYLRQGLYIVKSGKYSAKVLVTSNGIGGTTVQPVLKTPTAYVSPPPEINLRAGGGIKIYWNITTGNSVVPVEIVNVVNFKFTADNSIVFTLKSGTTVELENYQGIEFATEPAEVTTTSQWDMEKTLKFGGSSCAKYYMYEDECMAVVHNNGVIIYDVLHKKEIYISHTKIQSSVWTFFSTHSGYTGGTQRISIWSGPDGLDIGLTAPWASKLYTYIQLKEFGQGYEVTRADDLFWSHNKNTNLYETKIVFDNEKVKMSHINYKGEYVEYSFNGWNP